MDHHWLEKSRKKTNEMKLGLPETSSRELNILPIHLYALTYDLVTM